MNFIANKLSKKRKNKTEIKKSIFDKLPYDVIIHILLYDTRFYYTKEGQLFSRFSTQDYRYGLLSKIPKINYIWNGYFVNGTVITYMVNVVFLSKNKKHRYALSYFNEENTETRKVVFRNPNHEEMVCYI